MLFTGQTAAVGVSFREVWLSKSVIPPQKRNNERIAANKNSFISPEEISQNKICKKAIKTPQKTTEP